MAYILQLKDIECLNLLKNKTHIFVAIIIQNSLTNSARHWRRGRLLKRAQKHNGIASSWKAASLPRSLSADWRGKQNQQNGRKDLKTIQQMTAEYPRSIRSTGTPTEKEVIQLRNGQWTWTGSFQKDAIQVAKRHIKKKKNNPQDH